MAGRHQPTALLSATVANKSHLEQRRCVSSDPSLELVAAQSQINQYSVYNTCNYMLGTQCCECGGGEANPVNWEHLGCWVILEESRVVNMLPQLKSHVEGRAWTGSEEHTHVNMHAN